MISDVKKDVLNLNTCGGLSFSCGLPGFMRRDPIALGAACRGRTRGSGIRHGHLGDEGDVLEGAVDNDATINHVRNISAGTLCRLGRLTSRGAGGRARLVGRGLLGRRRIETEGTTTEGRCCGAVTDVGGTTVRTGGRTRLTGNRVLDKALRNVKGDFRGLVGRNHRGCSSARTVLVKITTSSCTAPSELFRLNISINSSTTLTNVCHSTVGVPGPNTEPGERSCSSGARCDCTLAE